MCEAMRSVTRLVLFVLCCVQCGLACSTQGPEVCYFQDSTTGQGTPTWCSWTSDGGWELSPDPHNSDDYAVRLAQDKDYGLLRSREACPVTSSCLSFYYYFTHGGDIDLSVYVTNTNNGDRVKLWSMSSPVTTGWNYASISMSTDFNFSVEFEAVRRPNSSGSYVYIDSVAFNNSSSCIFQPPYAAVVTTTPSTFIPATTATTTTTTTSTPTPPPPTSVLQHSITSLSTTTPHTSHTSHTLHTTTPHNDSENTASIGTIVGPVIAVLVLVVIIVVLVVILYRRNKLPEIQTCFNRKQSSRAKRGVGSGDHGNAVYVNDVADDDDDDTRMAVEADTGDYVDVADTSAAAAAQNTTRERHAVRVKHDAVYVNQTPAQGPHHTPSHPAYVNLGGSSTEHYGSVGGSSTEHYSSVGGSSTDHYSSVGGSSTEHYSSVGERSPPNTEHYSSVGGSSTEHYGSVGGSSTEHYSSVGERSPPNPYATLGSPPTDDVYSDVDPTCSVNTYTGLGARSPPHVYLSIGQTPDGGRRY